MVVSHRLMSVSGSSLVLEMLYFSFGSFSFSADDLSSDLTLRDVNCQCIHGDRSVFSIKKSDITIFHLLYPQKIVFLGEYRNHPVCRFIFLLCVTSL